MKSPDRSIFAPTILRVADDPRLLDMGRDVVSQKGRPGCYLALIGGEIGLPIGTSDRDVYKILGYERLGYFFDDIGPYDDPGYVFYTNPASALRAYVREYCR